MSTIRVVNLQHPDSVEPNVVLKTDGTAVFASGITISGSTNLTVSGTAEFASGTAANPEITFIDDNDTGIYSPAANQLGITANGSSKLVVTQSGVGVSTSSPGGPFEVQTATNERIIFDSAGASQQPRIQLLRDSGADYSIQNTLGIFEIRKNNGNLYRYASDVHQFFNVTGSNELLRIQSGGGISFNGDTATANALDDYEEGTWTPSITSGITSPSLTTANGLYTKIGRVLIFNFEIRVNSGTPNSTTFVIGGLPHTSANVPQNFGSVTINYNNLLTGFTELRAGHISTGSTSILFYNGTGTINGNSSGVNWINGRRLIGYGFSMTD